MHESSLVRSLLQQVEALTAAHRGRRVSSIRVQLGPLSGVESVLMSEAFQRLAPNSIAAEAELLLESVPLVGVCGTCQRDFASDELIFRCPHCGKQTVRIESGDGVILESITLEIVEPPRQSPEHASECAAANTIGP
jgi:hydrogenase nickel incorporation protein HypA/HybF